MEPSKRVKEQLIPPITHMVTRSSNSSRKIVLPLKSRSFKPIKHPNERDGANTFYSVAPQLDENEKLREERLIETGRKLRNFLKLPKAYKWAVCEWFYSSIDRVLLKEENDFELCLKGSFPALKTRLLCRFEWRIIRRLLGRPRRCSQLFFYEERRSLQKKRAKIRWLQVRRPSDPDTVFDIPPRIPKALPINSKVTAYLYHSSEVQSGLYNGVVQAVDPATSLYRIKFPLLGIGSFWISDAEVWCPDKYILYNVDTFVDVNRQIKLNSKPFLSSGITKLESGDVCTGVDASQSSEVADVSSVIESNLSVGGFPSRFLGSMVHLTKLLSRKKYLIDKLCCENSLAEETIARNLTFTLDFQEKYASLLLELEAINSDLKAQFEATKKFAQEMITQTSQEIYFPLASDIKSNCENKAAVCVDSLQKCPSLPLSSINLITKLTSILLQLKSMAEGEMRPFETEPLNDSLNEIKSMINETNLKVFQRDVEVNVSHIQSSIKLFGNLQAANNNYS